MCSDQSPWVVSDDLAYGFAAVSAGGSESDTCCSCFEYAIPESVAENNG